MVHRMIAVAGRVMHAVSGTFAPAGEANSRQVRVNGAITFLLAILGFFLFFFVAVSLGNLAPGYRIGPGLMVPFALVFYALAMVGGYRAVAGRSPKASHPGEFSPRRLLIGLFSILVAAGTVLLIAFGMDYADAGPPP